ncbi:MAG: Holliday junction branch migration protein RuvA [Planctomycetota bacterium]|nr:Holliday junction branch migration protein RuvA [Planctomycetota bacterium]
MYEAIRGTLLRREPAAAVVEAGGLAYLLHIPLSTYETLPEAGSEVTLRLHLAVRDDDWRLFGFGSDGERAVFRALLRVSGVGPVMALSLLSGFRPKEFRAAVAGGDVRALTRVKGVGKKTAERIVVELRDVWKDDASGVSPEGAPTASGPVEDAIRALQSLGLDGAEARKRVVKHAADDAGADASELIRKALRG